MPRLYFLFSSLYDIISYLLFTFYLSFLFFLSFLLLFFLSFYFFYFYFYLFLLPSFLSFFLHSFLPYLLSAFSPSPFLFLTWLSSFLPHSSSLPPPLPPSLSFHHSFPPSLSLIFSLFLLHDSTRDGLLALSILPCTINICVAQTLSAGGNMGTAIFNAIFANVLGTYLQMC